MALVRDPITGQMYDDGRPLPAGIAPTAAQTQAQAQTQTQAQNEARMRQNAAKFRSDVAAIPRNTLASIAAVPLTIAGVASGAIPLTYTSAREGRGDLQPTYAERQAEYQARQPSPLGAAEAQRVADRAVQAGVDYRNQMQAQVRPPVSLMALQQPAAPAAQAVQSSAPGGPAPRDYDAEVAAAVRPADPVRPTSADQMPQRGNYTQYNTGMADLQRRSAGGNGIDFGFGEGGARGYLDRMAAQDAAEAAARQQRGADARAALQRDQLTRQMASGDPFERRAARDRLLLEGGLTQQDMSGRTELERTRLAGQLGLQEANLRGQYGLQDTGLRGEYGLLDREMANAGQVEAERTRGLAGINAAREQVALDPRAGEYAQTAEQLRLRNEMARAALDNGQFDTALRATYGLQQLAPARQSTEIVNDAMGNPVGVRVGGVVQPLDPAMLEELRARGEIFRPQR